MTDSAPLAKALEDLKNGYVLIVGDAMLDRFVYGDVVRISPEAPIPVFSTDHETSMLGGAGNVARSAAALGVEVCFVSVTGDDGAGKDLDGLMAKLDRTEFSLIVEAGRKTSIKTRYIASGQQMMRADDETVAPLTPGARQKLLAAAMAGMKAGGVLVLSDYGKGVLDEGLGLELIQAARSRGMAVVADPQGVDYSRYAGASLITPNRKELADATGMAVDSEDAIIKAGAYLIENHGIDAVLATRSADGMTLIKSAQEFTHFPAHALEVFDVSGAGDTVAAALAAALSANLGEEQAVNLANLAAGIVVGKVGTAVAYGSEILDAFHSEHAAPSHGKIKSLGAALDTAQKWRAQGDTLGFAGGCFDLLHPGHLSLIGQAKNACDRLVIGLNSDASTGRLKGNGRPVQGEGTRAQVLAAMEAIDMVVIFGEDTPEDLIAALKPDVLVKGADYQLDELPEAKIVEAYGGRILLAKLEDGFSTTSTIARINGAAD
ncbi:MAG: D-glycero-beta-D-manno-heptose 1-phosphate adenylyltransferase [Rhodospirillales bacterium]|nr:D-glycero-beta-D-manno-heptose 1-phosphate adenylyltransferase [Rhodospirillales bacterium]